ncbi:hypothetical protein L218DRAFT_542546 [Marasmius fiardii PR-910]|nr:hypothetical protein L218DRAFT_542546 [Marasmius fiardii PR-910]
MSRRFPSALPGWETIREPPPSSEASSDDELQSISQSQPMRPRGGGDSGSKRRLGGRKDTLPKPKKQRLGQSGNGNGNGNDSLPTIESDRFRVPSLTQPVPSTSWSSFSTSAPTPKRVQMRKPTGENYPKRPNISFPVPNSSKLTTETSNSKPVPSRPMAKQLSQSNSAWGTSDRQAREDSNGDDVLIISSSSSASPVPAPARTPKGKGKVRQTSPREQTTSQPSFKGKGKAQITLASSGEDDQDIMSVRYGQLQRKESGKARAEKTVDVNKQSGSTIRNKGLRADGRPNVSTTGTERVTTKPMKRSKAKKERRKSLGDAFATPSDSDQGNEKTERESGSATGKTQTVQPDSNVIELSSDEEPTKSQPKKIEIKNPAVEEPEPKNPDDVIDVSDADTPPSTQRKTSLPAIIDLTLDDGPEDGEDGATVSSAVLRSPAGCGSSVREQSTCRNTLTSGSARNVDLEDTSGSEMMMTTDEAPMMDIVSGNVDNRAGTKLDPSMEIEPFSSETGMVKSLSTHSPQVKQQSMSPTKGNRMINLGTFPSTPQPAPGSPHSSPKKEPPPSPQKISPLKPERACRLASDESPSSLGSPPRSGKDKTPPSFTPPSSGPPVRQEQVTLPSSSRPEPSTATLDLAPNHLSNTPVQV